MRDIYPSPSYSIKEKAALAWLTVFTGAALISQVLSWLGKDAIAIPELAYSPPFESIHHPLGTDQLGRDLLFYLFLGCRSAWLIAIPPIFCASVIGVVIGTGAAILGNDRLRISFVRILILFLLFLLLYYGCYMYVKFSFIGPTLLSKFAIIVGLLVLFFLLTRVKSSSTHWVARQKLTIAVDDGVQKIINIWSSIPKLLLLLLLASLTTFSLISLMGWICASYWVLPARVTRASVLQSQGESYYEASQALGVPLRRVFRCFLWPKMKGTILTNFCFAASGLIGIGSTMAYLGIGIPADVPTWGKTLANSRLSVDAWWLLVFPSLMILFTIFSLQAIGNKFSRINNR